MIYMNEPCLRAAVAAEIEAVRDIERRSAGRFADTPFPELVHAEPTDAATLMQRIAAGGLIVATEAGEPVAFVMFREVDGGGYVEQIDVAPEHAGRRIGAALLDRVAEVGRTRGWDALTLSTFRDVPWNAPYYRRLGFIEIEEAALTPGLRSIRAEHLRRGLDETRRVFMRRPS